MVGGTRIQANSKNSCVQLNSGVGYALEYQGRYCNAEEDSRVHSWADVDSQRVTGLTKAQVILMLH